jgi:hypothetical protein
MTMTPGVRKAAFLAHVAFSVGWIGAVVAYLALAWSGLRGTDVELARSAYLSMELVGWSVIVPLSLATLASGLVQSLFTEWGLFRHYWITAKFLMAAVGSLILLMHMRAVGQMAGFARATSLSAGDFGDLRISLVVHAVGGLLLLLTATALSIYKPWGMTPYGRRKQQEKSAAVAVEGPSSLGTRRGMYIVLGVIGAILLLLLLHHLAGGGPRHH